VKFVRFVAMDSDKVAAVAQASDKVWATPPSGVKMLSNYACLGIAFPNQSPNTIVTIGIMEAESPEALTAVSYPLALAGGAVWSVPILDVPVAGATEIEKKARG
jgi:hypothetical protein